MEKFILKGHEFQSRLLTGTGKFSDKNLVAPMLEASGSQIITMALRRINFQNPKENILNYIPKHITLLPNTSGARTAEEAVKIARIAREAGCGNFIKIEIINDSKYLMPDNAETIKATKILADEGFIVLPYVMPDLITADETRYAQVHLSGEKRNFRYRLDTPERGAKAGIRAIGIGALLGLGGIRDDAFKTGLHLKYLMDRYPNSEFSISFPRINEAEGNFKDSYAVDDVTFVQIILANRIFQPKAGINLSTRESAYMRDHLVTMGVTKFSAGSKTEVGGYSHDNESTAQFDITDSRDVDSIVEAIRGKGLEVFYKDWETLV